MINATVLKKEFVNNDVFLLTIKCETVFSFIAGQFITIKINDHNNTPCFRSYSISSAPTKDNILEICIKKIKNGRGSTWLSNLKNNDKIQLIGPSGNMIFKQSNSTSIFIATGTGVAPFKSIITDELQKGNKTNLHLIFGLRHIKDIFYKEFFEKLEKQYLNFKFTITLSRPEDKKWNQKIGRVTKHLEEFNLPTKSNYYICGLKTMIESVLDVLDSKKISRKNVHFEKFD